MVFKEEIKPPALKLIFLIAELVIFKLVQSLLTPPEYNKSLAVSKQVL
jgi:hypothetical protein